MIGINQLLYDIYKASRVEYDVDSAQPNYIGLHADPDANDDDAGWIIWNIEYSGSNIKRMKRKKGVWSQRTTLF